MSPNLRGDLVRRVVRVLLLFSIAACANQGPPAAQPMPPPPPPPTLTSEQVRPETDVHYATVNGVKIGYLKQAGGGGAPVVLLHGYAETSHMWRPLIASLAQRHTVLAPDLRGVGMSDKPEEGYDKKTLAADVHALVESFGYKRVKLVGHDIGLMVAYAYAAQYPDEVESIALMDAFLPGIGEWKDVWLMRDLWHFHFYGETPLALVTGRERIYLEHFWNDFAADRRHSVPEEDRRFYTAAYSMPGAMRAGMEYFRAFSTDATDFQELAKSKLPMPMLVLTGEKASGKFLIEQACLVATKVQGVVIPGSGHWLMEEAPSEVIPRLVAFADGEVSTPASVCPPRPPSEVRLTAAEIAARQKEGVGAGTGAGTSGATGILTTVVKGDPSKSGLYTIVLRVPPNTRIDAHSHPDDRVATVVSGTWSLGYGDKFDEQKLKALPPGSFYTEPPSQPHFARTGATAAVIQISGAGPTATSY
jgi:pimeloyl-ACP methyl ester carboxylesterase/uncharacterized RmlC-like cupin family protein